MFSQVNRSQKLKLNTVASLLSRLAILLSGLILPRLILLYYGSETNGLVASITQFLIIITFLDLGVGSVVQSVLYRPLAEKDHTQVNKVLSAAKNYFSKILYILIFYVLILSFTYPMMANNPSLDFLSTALLIIAMSIGTFAQYYFGIVNELLLNADQKGYVQFSTEIIVIVLNLVMSIFLITQGASIQIVKLFSSLIFLIRPIYLSYYVRKHYNLDYHVEVSEDPLPQKWNGMGQHIAYSIQNSTDVIILTLFSTLTNISIYNVYNMVVQAIKLIISSLAGGLTPFFGNLLATEELDSLNDYFTKIEWFIHTIVVFLYSMTAVLINPFIMLYTSGVTDADYEQPVFSLLLVLTGVIYSMRIPYRMLIFAAGHFKETQTSSILEAVINIVLSLILVQRFGLVGVTIGTLISMLYWTLYIVFYLQKNIVYRSAVSFFRHIIIDIGSFTILYLLGIFMVELVNVDSFISWLFVAVVLGLVFVVIMLVTNLIFYKSELMYYLKRVFKKLS